MAITINGSGTVTGISVGGLPDGIVDADMLASGVPAITTTSGTNNFTVADGDLVIGTSGHGISFSATSDGPTMANELLDDYEEGTWVPTCANSVTLDSGQDLVQYVKIGRVVHLAGQIRINSSNSNQNFIITNLPFATSANLGESTGEQYYLASTYDLNHDGDCIGIRFVSGSATQNCNLVDVKDDGGYAAVQAEDGKYVIMSTSYICQT